MRHYFSWAARSNCKTLKFFTVFKYVVQKIVLQVFVLIFPINSFNFYTVVVLLFYILYKSSYNFHTILQYLQNVISDILDIFLLIGLMCLCLYFISLYKVLFAIDWFRLVCCSILVENTNKIALVIKDLLMHLCLCRIMLLSIFNYGNIDNHPTSPLSGGLT